MDIIKNKTIRKSLSASEAKAISELAAEGNSVFTIKELQKKIFPPARARQMAFRLVRKGWLERLNRGVYLVLELGAGSTPSWTEDAYYIASKLVEPYYIGYYNMLNHYGWTEQVPQVVMVATNRPIKEKEIQGIRYKFIYLSGRKFFGLEEQNIRGRKIRVSDKEKTIIDALDHPEYCGGIEEVAKCLYNAQKEIDWERLLAYAEKTGNSAVFKRLGYLCEVMEIPLRTRFREKMRSEILTGYALLFPGVKTANARHNSKWGLLLNALLTKERVLA